MDGNQYRIDNDDIDNEEVTIDTDNKETIEIIDQSTSLPNDNRTIKIQNCYDANNLKIITSETNLNENFVGVDSFYFEQFMNVSKANLKNNNELKYIHILSSKKPLTNDRILPNNVISNDKYMDTDSNVLLACETEHIRSTRKYRLYIDQITGITTYYVRKKDLIIENKLLEEDDNATNLQMINIKPNIMPSNYDVIINTVERKFYSKHVNDAPIDYILPTIEQWECYFNLPYGYEPAIDSYGQIYFINYNNCTTTNFLPNYYMIDSTPSVSSFKSNDSPWKIKVNIDLTRINDNNEMCIDWDTILDKNCCVKNPNIINNKNISDINMKVGDRLVRINSHDIKNIGDVKNILQDNLSSYSIEIVRETNHILPKEKWVPVKSSILSESRRLLNKTNKVSVHFAEKPIILEYQRDSVRKQTELNTIEIKYDNVIRIKLETGMIKTVKVSNNHTVHSVIELILGKLNYKHIDMFYLALVDSTQTNVHYFSHRQKMSKIMEYKKNDVTLECRILILHPPHDIKTWLDPQFKLCFDYLFFQHRNMLLSGNIVKNDMLCDKTLLHLIGFVVATDQMVECLSKLEIFVNKHNSIKSIDDIDLTNIGKLIIPNSFLANFDCRIEFVCKSIVSFDLREHVLNIFCDLLPENFFRLIFAETKQLEEARFSISETVCNQFKHISNNAQLAFLQLATQFNLVGIHRFRVHIIECPGVNIQEPKPTGLPFHFYIDFHSGYGITKDTSNFTMLVGCFINVLGIIVFFNGDGRRVISILSQHERPLTFITPERECDNIVTLLESICTTKFNLDNQNSHNYKLPIIDLTDLTRRVSTCELPAFYNHTHIFIPSKWNHTHTLERFVTNFSSTFENPNPFNAQNYILNSRSTITIECDADNIDDTFNKVGNLCANVTDEKFPLILPYLLVLKQPSSLIINKDNRQSSNTNDDNIQDDEEDAVIEEESLSKNPWLKKIINADEIDIRLRNSFSKNNNNVNINNSSLNISCENLSTHGSSPKITDSSDRSTETPPTITNNNDMVNYSNDASDSVSSQAILQSSSSRIEPTNFTSLTVPPNENSGGNFIEIDVDEINIDSNNECRRKPPDTSLRPTIVEKLLKTFKSTKKNRKSSVKK